MAGNFDVETLGKLRNLCHKTNSEKCNVGDITELKRIIKSMHYDSTPLLQETVLTCLYKYLVPNENKENFKEHLLREVVDTLAALFDKTRVTKLRLFFNIYAFLFTKLFNAEKNKIEGSASEELKLSIVTCLKNLIQSLSSHILLDLYRKENALKLGQMLYILLELAKFEKLRQLRLESMQCILAIAQMDSESKYYDIGIRNEVANILAHFLPGIVIAMRNVALEDAKSGHKIPMIAIRTFGRITVLMMQDYEKNGLETEQDFQESMKEIKTRVQETEKMSKEQKMKDSVINMKRDKPWFQRCDGNLKNIIIDFQKLTKYQHVNVRSELADISAFIVENCTITMPNSIGPLIEILITLSQDETIKIAEKSQGTLTTFTSKLSLDGLKILTDNLEEMFFEAVGRLPKIFNGFDEYEQATALNLILGYLKIFESKNMQHIFKSVSHINHLILILIHISELENSDSLLFEENIVQDLEMIHKDKRTPWKNFKYFQSNLVKNKLVSVFKALGTSQNFELVYTIITDIVSNDEEHCRESILILNELLTANYEESKDSFIKDTINRFTANENSNLLITASGNFNRDSYTLKEVQQNIIQICLQMEGIGKIALAMKNKFEMFLLQTLYTILEYTGSGNGLLRLAGLQAIANISIATNCKTVTELINKNSDYFSYHVIRKLKRFNCSEGALNVLSIVLNYSGMDILDSITEIIDGVVYHSSTEGNRIKTTAYLRIFDVIMTCMHRWLNISIQISPLKTREDRLNEMESFQVGDLEPEITDFSDDVTSKGAEEMFREDMEKSKAEIEEELEPPDEQYQKPDPPRHIKLTVKILQRSLNFLSSKESEKQLLSLKILRNGVEVIRDWEDELLPLVHLIWDPLVGRFEPMTDPLTVNLSFQLLMTLARLSKDFIRSRTAKEVLPNLSKTMRKLSNDSYLKDKGNSYRYKQAYKFQLVVLEHLGRLLVDLDVGDIFIDVALECLLPYLSNKQPLPLQKFAVESCKTLVTFDPKMMETQLKKLKIVTDIKSNVNEIRSCLT